jgi:hypothetical protein
MGTKPHDASPHGVRKNAYSVQVLGMYMDFAAAGFCLAVFSGVLWMGSVMVHDVREERQAAYFRRHEKELELKGHVSAP